MRIFLWFVILTGFLIVGDIAQAKTGFEFEKATLSSDWTAGEDAKTALSAGFQGNWDGFRFSINSKLYLQPVEDSYSSVDTKFVLPQLTDDLGFGLKYQWNQRYNLLTAGADYQWEINKDLDLDLKLEHLLRNGENEEAREFRYSQNLQQIDLDYDLDPWSYEFKLNRTTKNYPQKTIYAATKITLDQKIDWSVTPWFELGLAYQEATGDHPFSSTRDYWKEKWTLSGDYDIRELWQLDLKYSTMQWDQNLDSPYRTEQRFEVKLVSVFDSDWRLTVSASVADLKFSLNQVHYEPDDEITEEENVNNRIEQKFSLEIRRYLPNHWFGLGYIWADYDYKSASVPDRLKSGFYGLIDWEFDKITLALKMAPAGDLQRRAGYYQLKLEYKP